MSTTSKAGSGKGSVSGRSDRTGAEGVTTRSKQRADAEAAEEVTGENLPKAEGSPDHSQGPAHAEGAGGGTEENLTRSEGSPDHAQSPANAEGTVEGDGEELNKSVESAVTPPGPASRRPSPAPSAAESSSNEAPQPVDGAEGPTEEASEAAGGVPRDDALPPMTPSPPRHRTQYEESDSYGDARSGGSASTSRDRLTPLTTPLRPGSPVVTYTPDRYLDTTTAAASPLHKKAVMNLMRGRVLPEGSQEGRGGISPISRVGGRTDPGDLSPRVDEERVSDQSFGDSEDSELAYTQGALEQAMGRVVDGGVRPIHPLEGRGDLSNSLFPLQDTRVRGLPQVGAGSPPSRRHPKGPAETQGDQGWGPSDPEDSQSESSGRASEVTRHLHEVLEEVEEAHGHVDRLDMTVEEELGRVNTLVTTAQDLQVRQDQQRAEQVARWESEWEDLGLSAHGSQGGEALPGIQQQALATQNELVQMATDRGSALHTELAHLSESAEQLIEQRRRLTATHTVMGQSSLDAKALLRQVESPEARNDLAGPGSRGGTHQKVTQRFHLRVWFLCRPRRQVA